MPCHSSTRYSPIPRRIALTILAAVLFLSGALCASAQESYLASVFYGGLSVFDLNTSNLTEAVNAGANNFSIITGPNPRLAFLSTGQYLSVIDLTIQREIRRMPEAAYSRFAAITPDGKYLLKWNQTLRTLDVIDIAAFKIARRVELAGILRNGSDTLMGSIVVVGSKAYVTTKHPAGGTIALVDLHTFRARAVLIPNSASVGGRCLPNAAATPDGKYVVMIEATHLIFLNTATNKIDIDETLPDNNFGIAITPNGSDPSKVYGYLLRNNGQYVASVVDLRPGSPTFGQLIAKTDVNLVLRDGVVLSGFAINPEGTRLVVAGQQYNYNGPGLPNLLVIDTALMLTNPGSAIVGQGTAADDTVLEGVAIASIVTTVPPTAPAVTGVSGNVTNDKDTTVHVYGSNFASGAQVRIGSMALLPATVLSSSDLEVTIPKNSPAGANLDVIVTNPNVKSSPSLQNQSGLLEGGITISPTPAFQPKQQFGMALLGGAADVYDLQQESIFNLQAAPPLSPPYPQVVFNSDGAELYGLSFGPGYSFEPPQALDWKLADNSLQALVTVPDGTFVLGFSGIEIAVNPSPPNGPILYVPGQSGLGTLDLNMIDTNPASPTYNTIIRTIQGLNQQGDYYDVYTFAATPGGKYVYMNYFDYNSDSGMLAIFDIVNGGPATTLTMSSLGADDYQYEVQVSPDGTSLLLQQYYFGSGGYTGNNIMVYNIATNPKSPTLLATITGSVPSGVPPYLNSFQVVGNRLFALDTNSQSILAFNFDDVHLNFNQLAVYQLPSNATTYLFTVSPDGALIYLPIYNPDMVMVFDANLLAGGQPPFITNIATGIFPYQVAVSPISTKHRVAPQAHKPPVENHGQPGFGHNLAE
jgi:IPT/TIG domain